MPPNNSSSGGYLLPTPGAIPPGESEDAAFLDFMHDVIQGVTGLEAPNVRPRWQQNPPDLPERDTDWVAFGVSSRTPDQTGFEAHYGEGEGRTALVVYEDCDLLHSFYGPNADAYAVRLRSGLLLSQNREAMQAAQIGVKRFAGPLPVPVLVKQEWLYRCDLTVTLRRQVRAVYPILSIVTGVGIVVSETGSTPFVAGE